jgi:pyrroline-5-carboxylate reductase
MLNQKVSKHMTFKIGFIGAGNMAGAIIGGLVKQLDSKSIYASALNTEKLNAFADKYSINAVTSNEEIFEYCDVVVLSVKPQIMQTVIAPLASLAQAKQPLVISVAAGLSSETLESWLGGALPLVRVMPNTPSLVGLGASGCFANERVSEAQKSIVDTVFSAIGEHIWVDKEDLIHSVTATSGSAPAYFFMFMEAMIAAAEKQGLTNEQAKTLVAQTALGSAQMVKTTGEQPADLRRKVTSPGGTTAEAVRTFEEQNLMNIVEQAMQACTNRSIELSEILANA